MSKKNIDITALLDMHYAGIEINVEENAKRIADIDKKLEQWRNDIQRQLTRIAEAKAAIADAEAAIADAEDRMIIAYHYEEPLRIERNVLQNQNDYKNSKENN